MKLSIQIIHVSQPILAHIFSRLPRHFSTSSPFSFYNSSYIMATPVGNSLKWKLTVDSIGKSVETLMDKTKLTYDAVGKLNPEDVTYENVLKVAIN